MHALQVDDTADRAVLNQIAHMMVDLAISSTTTPPTNSTSGTTITGNTNAKDNENALEPDADATLPVDKETSVGTSPLASQRDPGKSSEAVHRDIDDVNGSAAASSAPSSAAGDSPEDIDRKPCLQPSGGRPSSSVDRSEGLDEAYSREEAAHERESVRCDLAMKLNT